MSSFKFVSLLSGLHLLASGAFVRLLQGGQKRGSGTTLDFETMLLIFWTVCSLESLNLSLMLNTVSFYQATKLLIIPCTAIIEYCFGGNLMSRWQFLFVFQTLVGVALVTINDVKFDASLTGVIIALISVLTSSLQQSSVRKMQSVRRKDALDLIASVGPGSGVILFIFSPVMDYRIAHQWITEYSWNNMVILGILLSTTLAILVNVSQYLCLDKFSAVEFQPPGLCYMKISAMSNG
eukprot:jgi/Picsp_1/6176/NSC_03530-R1_protein